jgi:N-acetylglucosamine malate deacetylase 2
MLPELLVRATLDGDSQRCAPYAMLVFAHPDDETIALGARLSRFASSLLVHVTDGAPRNGQDSRSLGFASVKEYRSVREKELHRALSVAGLENIQRISLEIPDQEASLHLRGLIADIEALFLKYRPDIVFTHPYEGGHPDHDACAFAVQRSSERVQGTGLTSPLIIEAVFYHAGPNGIETGCFLPHLEQTAEIHYPLSPDEQHRKQALLACFTTQQQTLQYFPVERESFRIAPRYDFHRPPHDGPVFYDRFSWGMTSARFCELTVEADAVREELGAACH